MKHSSTQQIYDYWVSRRGGRSAPERSEIEPNAIRSALADTFILAYEPREGHRFRLAGARVNATMGRDLRDRSLVELFSRPQRALVAKLIAPVVEEASGIVASVSGWTIDSLSANLELLLLPLKHHGATDARMLGVLVALSPPRWIGSKPLHEMIFGNVRHLGEDTHPLRGRDLRHRELRHPDLQHGDLPSNLQPEDTQPWTTDWTPAASHWSPTAAPPPSPGGSPQGRVRNGLVVYDGGLS